MLPIVLLDSCEEPERRRKLLFGLFFLDLWGFPGLLEVGLLPVGEGSAFVHLEVEAEVCFGILFGLTSLWLLSLLVRGFLLLGDGPRELSHVQSRNDLSCGKALFWECVKRAFLSRVKLVSVRLGLSGASLTAIKVLLLEIQFSSPVLLGEFFGVKESPLWRVRANSFGTGLIPFLE